MMSNGIQCNYVDLWQIIHSFLTDSVLSRLLFVGNLPPELEESQLNEMFPDGKRAILARNEEREQCG